MDEKGYVVFPNALSRKKCKKLTTKLMNETVNIVFTNRGYDVTQFNLQDRIQLLVDPKRRKDVFGEEANNSVWRNGNSRKPIHSKSCGMINIHYYPKLLKYVTLNSKLYRNMAEVYEYEDLVHTQGFERVGIKPQGTPDMDKHFDINPFNKDVNYDDSIRHRIQSLITLSIDEECNARDSGTIEMIPYFHLYFEFFSHLCHPVTGLGKCKMKGSKVRFFPLPNGEDGWDKHILPSIRKYSKEYRRYLSKEKKGMTEEEKVFYKKLKKNNVCIPTTEHPLIWTPIKSNIGDHILWDERIPHRNLRNRGKKARVVAYYSLFPVDKDWYNSPERKWLRKQIRKRHIYYSNGKRNEIPVNIDEIIHEEKVKELLSTEFAKKISGKIEW